MNKDSRVYIKIFFQEKSLVQPKKIYGPYFQKKTGYNLNIIRAKVNIDNLDPSVALQTS